MSIFENIYHIQSCWTCCLYVTYKFRDRSMLPLEVNMVYNE